MEIDIFYISWNFREIVKYIKKRNVQEFEEQRINLEQKTRQH